MEREKKGYSIILNVKAFRFTTENLMAFFHTFCVNTPTDKKKTQKKVCEAKASFEVNSKNTVVVFVFGVIT